MTSFAKACSSSPLTGSISIPLLRTSAKSSGSLSALDQASRRIFARSSGIPGELDLFNAEQLIKIQARLDRRQGQPVGFGHAVNIVSGNPCARSRHIAYDDVRIAWNVLAHAATIKASPAITHRTRRRSRKNRDALSLKVRHLRLKRRGRP